jgi:hypothetical protein
MAFAGPSAWAPPKMPRRPSGRRGSKRAIGRSILVITWHLLANPDADFRDLGPGFYAERIDPERRKRKRNHTPQVRVLLGVPPCYSSSGGLRLPDV